MKKWLSVVLVLLVAVMIAACGNSNQGSSESQPPGSSGSGGGQSAQNSGSSASSGSSGEVIRIKYGTAEQADMAPGTMSQWVTDEINKRAEGRIVVEHYGQSVLGNDAELMQQGLDGTLQIFAVGTSAFSQYNNLFDAVQLPFLITDYDIQYQALKSPEFMALVEQVEKDLDIKFLGFAENGLRHFATIEKPVHNVSDLKGMKIRIAPSNMLQRAMESLGANPISMPYTEVFTGLQNRVIDGEEINIGSIASQKHYEVINYLSEIGMYPFPATYWMNGKFYRSLSEEDFQLIKTVFEEGRDKVFNELLPQIEGNFRQTIIDAGVQVNVIEDKTEFQQIVEPLYGELEAADERIAAFINMVKGLKK